MSQESNEGGTEDAHSLLSFCLLHLSEPFHAPYSHVRARSQAEKMSLESGDRKCYKELLCFPFCFCDKTLIKTNWGQEKACLAHTSWSQCLMEGSPRRVKQKTNYCSLACSMAFLICFLTQSGPFA